MARRTNSVSKKYDRARKEGAEMTGKIVAYSIVGLFKGSVGLFRIIRRYLQKRNGT